MEVTETSEQVKIEAQRFEDVARYNIRRYMRLTGKIQKDLARLRSFEAYYHPDA